MQKVLTKAEEQVMHVLWKLKKGFLKDVINSLPDPKPHSNTVSTILKILIEKKYVGIETFGRLHKYYPVVRKEEYSRSSMKNIVKGYFEGSFKKAVSFMIENKELSVKDLELLLEQIKKQKK